MDRAKGDYVDEINLVFVTFADSSSIVLQFRPASRPLDTAAFSSVRSQLGSLVPDIQLLNKIQNGLVLVYKMTRLPGDSFSEIAKTPDFIHLLPFIAASVGHLLGKCYIPGSRSGDNHAWLELAQEHIRSAVDSNEPSVVVHQTHYRQLLDVLRSGTLDDLPLAISNNDVSPTNIIIHKGVSAGLVDWEDVYQWPLGWETRAVFWLMGTGRDEDYISHGNASHIADAFWKAFWAQLPAVVRTQSTAIRSAMQIGAALSTSLGGRYNAGHFASLPVMLSYNIPLAF